MDVASIPSLSSIPRRCERPRTGSSSSLIPLFTHNGCCLGLTSFRQASLRTSYHAAQKMIFRGKSKHIVASLYFHCTKSEFGGQQCDLTLQKTNKSFKYVVPRMGVSGATSMNSPYQEPELTLGSKIRGICFYAVTAAAAISLFGLMVIGHPFVLPFVLFSFWAYGDLYRRKLQHLIAKLWARMTIAPFFDIGLEGLENLPPPDTPAVYVSNHQNSE